MKLVATIHVYDRLQDVVISAEVRGYSGNKKVRNGVVLHCATTFPGVGNDDPRTWLRDALVELSTRL